MLKNWSQLVPRQRKEGKPLQKKTASLWPEQTPLEKEFQALEKQRQASLTPGQIAGERISKAPSYTKRQQQILQQFQREEYIRRKLEGSREILNPGERGVPTRFGPPTIDRRQAIVEVGRDLGKPGVEEGVEDIISTDIDSSIEAAIAQGSLRTQEIAAEYQAWEAQNELQRQALVENANLRRTDIQDLRESERIRQALALIGAGTGGSGLGSQLAQKTSLKTFNTLREFQREYQNKLNQNDIQSEIQRRKMLAKIKGDRAFTDALNASTIGNKETSFSINGQTLDIVEQTLGSEASPQTIGESWLDNNILSGIKDAKKREDFGKKWRPLMGEIFNFFKDQQGKTNNLELNFRKDKGEMTFINKNTGSITTFDSVNKGGIQTLESTGGNVEHANIDKVIKILGAPGSGQSFINFIKANDADYKTVGTLPNKVIALIEQKPAWLERFIVKAYLPSVYVDFTNNKITEKILDQINENFAAFNNPSTFQRQDSLKRDLWNKITSYWRDKGK